METSIAFLVALTVALVELAKKIGVPTRFAPLLSVFVGVSLSMVPGFANWQSQLFTGLVIGLTSAGLWDLGKQPVVAIVERLKK